MNNQQPRSGMLTLRWMLIAPLCLIIFSLSAWLGQSAPPEQKVKLLLIDAETTKPIPGLIRVFPKNGKEPLVLTGLMDRLQGLKKTGNRNGWYVVPAQGAVVALPRQSLRVEAISGLETEMAQQAITVQNQKQIRIKLKAIFRPLEQNRIAGNTHLHLRNMTLDQATQYVQAIPLADRLKVLFLSYLERNKDDKHYITNRYPIGDLTRIQPKGLLVNNGEEHRHNFKPYDQGYGHVMFLNIKKLIKPVSLGPGITAKGNDDRPLLPGVMEAKKQGGSVIWCHNTFGHEDIPHALAGRLDAVNVFDGSRRDKYGDTYYHYLNIGLSMPISTGTDWYMYDFARVYARLDKGEKLTIPNWLKALKQGRNCITNGPLLTLTVNGRQPGEAVKLEKPQAIEIEVKGVGRLPFGQLQLLHNGKVIASRAATKSGQHHRAEIKHRIRPRQGGWLAARIETDERNEFEQGLFAHTSPVYLEWKGQRAFELDSAQELLRQLELGRGAIQDQGKFSSKKAESGVLQIYEDAIAELKRRINARKPE